LLEERIHVNFKHVSFKKFILLLLFGAAWDVGGSEALGSTQFWPSAGMVWDVNAPWMLQFKETYYHVKDDSDSDHAKSDVTSIYKGPKDIFDLGLGFTYVDGSEETKQERRPYVSATLRGKLFDRDVSNRFMVEYREFSSASDYWRFRDKVTLNSMFESGDTRGIRLLNRDRFRPYLADEVFFNSNGQGFSQNRAYLGVKIKIVKNVGADVYYLYQSVENSSNRWQDNHIIGMDITFSF
jgi:hypothetical protein